MNRPIGILLLLWPTLWEVWIAGNGHPAWHIVLIFVLGTVLMCFADALSKTKHSRSLACGLSAAAPCWARLINH